MLHKSLDARRLIYERLSTVMTVAYSQEGITHMMAEQYDE